MTELCPTCGAVVCASNDGRGTYGSAASPDVIELLTDIAESGVDFDDARMRYLVVQIDRHDWEALRSLAAKLR